MIAGGERVGKLCVVARRVQQGDEKRLGGLHGYSKEKDDWRHGLRGGLVVVLSGDLVL